MITIGIDPHTTWRSPGLEVRRQVCLLCRPGRARSVPSDEHSNFAVTLESPLTVPGSTTGGMSTNGSSNGERPGA